MPVELGFDPTSTNQQKAIINDATSQNDGCMTKAQAAALAFVIANAPLVPQTTISLVDTVTKAILSIDMSKVPDGSSALTMLYAVEATDGVNVQIQSGILNANVARAANGSYATSQTPTGTANTVTQGGMSVTFSWTTAGGIATLNVNANSSLTPTKLAITLYIPYATHPAAISVVQS